MVGYVATPRRTTSPLTTITLFKNIGFCPMLPQSKMGAESWCALFGIRTGSKGTCWWALFRKEDNVKPRKDSPSVSYSELRRQTLRGRQTKVSFKLHPYSLKEVFDFMLSPISIFFTESWMPVHTAVRSVCSMVTTLTSVAGRESTSTVHRGQRS